MGETLKQKEGRRWIHADVLRDTRRISQAVSKMDKAVENLYPDGYTNDRELHYLHQALREEYAKVADIIHKMNMRLHDTLRRNAND